MRMYSNFCLKEKKMIFKILIDNISKDKLKAEWGLAVYIDYEGTKFLLDTGSSGRFVKNAEQMGIDLSEVEYGILSHAHYDHANGMESFFNINDKAKFVLRDGAEENCYGKRCLFYQYIGIKKGYLDRFQDRIVYAKGDYEIVPGVYLIPHKIHGQIQKGSIGSMYIKKNNKFCPDVFSHEQSLVFDTEKGLVIFNSCSHTGADNIIKEVADTFPEKKIYAMVGGFHLVGVPKEAVRALARRIKETGIQKVITGHCTGKRAFRVLQEELGSDVLQMYVGMEYEV